MSTIFNIITIFFCIVLFFFPFPLLQIIKGIQNKQLLKYSGIVIVFALVLISSAHWSYQSSDFVKLEELSANINSTEQVITQDKTSNSIDKVIELDQSKTVNYWTIFLFLALYLPYPYFLYFRHMVPSENGWR